MNNKQKTLFSLFNRSSEDNGIVEYSQKLSQASSSGPSYRASLEHTARKNMKARFEDDLMKPYQDTFRNQIPAILLAMGDDEALMKVILKKMSTAENEQRLAKYLLESKYKGKGYLTEKWEEFKLGLTKSELKMYEGWIKTFMPSDEIQDKKQA
tara:strand:- start:798 stop:1259 length:462 start_codon:yes stop_codon:yes gene_type:complete